MIQTPRPVSSLRTQQRGQPPSDVVRRAPVALRLTALDDLPPLVLAGLEAALEPYGARVRLHPAGPGSDVMIADLSHRVGPIRVPSVESPLVVLVRDGDLEATRVARNAGVAPLAMSATADRLVRTVESAHRLLGRPVSPPESRHSRLDPVVPLSAREEEVLTGICAGLSNLEIAEQLYLSINSVKTYIRSAYRKMGVARRNQAVLWGLQRGYGEREPA